MQTRVRPLWGLPAPAPPARGSARIPFSAAAWMLATRPTFLRLRVPEPVLSVCTITPAWQAGSVAGSCIYSRRCTVLASLLLTDLPCVIVSRFVRIIATDAASFLHGPAMLHAMNAHDFLHRPPVRGAQGASRSWPLEAGLQRTLGTAVFRVTVFSGVCPIVGFLVTRCFHS